MLKGFYRVQLPLTRHLQGFSIFKSANMSTDVSENGEFITPVDLGGKNFHLLKSLHFTDYIMNNILSTGYLNRNAETLS